MDGNLQRRRLSSVAMWTATGLCVALITLVESQGIQTIPSTAYVKTLAKRVDLLCRSDKPIDACSVQIPGIMGTHDIRNLPHDISYYGDSLHRGDCGIEIARLKTSNEGKFYCNLTIGGELFQETIDIVIAVAPKPTEIELGRNTIIQYGGLAPNQTLAIKCISQDAVPQANLSWFLEDDPIGEEFLGPIVTSVTDDKKGKKLTTVTQLLNYPITAADCGKKIVCRAEHFAIAKSGYYRAFLPLNIRIPPQPIPSIYIGEGTHAVVNVTVKSNPRPKTSWRVNGIVIDEGQSVGPYQAYIPKDMDYGNYLVLLKINEQTEQTELFELIATNELGTQTYVIKASKFPATDGDDDNDVNNEVDPKSGAVFWLISLWTFFSSVIVTCLLRVP
ncbi:fasciclin-3-like [Topomyia yanbarensis]|uniref:fasciclin-3-like n=1 Tax=Topomyia yanbarensis TaxID=2498891 RepID=UPI00273BCF09|nr:fasciclin-3-like [Topomyia yanbarensis]